MAAHVAHASLSAERMRELQSLAVQKVSARLPDASAETEMRFKLGLKRLLGKYDADGSGVLETAELARALGDVIVGVDASELLALAAAYDADGSGAVTIDEFAAALLATADASDAARWRAPRPSWRDGSDARRANEQCARRAARGDDDGRG